MKYSQLTFVMDLLKRQLKVAVCLILVFAGLLFVWDWSHYRLPYLLESKLSPSGYDPFAPVPRESIVANWIKSLRSNKAARVARAWVREENRKRWERFADFQFGGDYLSCENAIVGRWFLHFEKDGGIETAVPGDKRFAKDYQDTNFPVIDLGEIFQPSTTYRRIDDRTMEFSNATGTWRFAVSPRLEELDSVLGISGVAHCYQILFVDLERPDFQFELCREERNASKFDFFRNQQLKEYED